MKKERDGGLDFFKNKQGVSIPISLTCFRKILAKGSDIA